MSDCADIEWAAWQTSRAAALKEAAKVCEDAVSRAAALEEAAQVCDEEATIEGIAQRCAARIRALAKGAK